MYTQKPHVVRSFGSCFSYCLKRFVSVALSLCLMMTLVFVPVDAQANPKYASLVIDADTGLVLHERHADKKLHPASLTKIMTLLMTFEAIEARATSLKSRVRVSNHAASMVPSKIGLKPGSSIRVEDAIYALVTKSANDVAAALAEHLGGTEAKFARMMTRRARDIGMTRTTFRNASGLHHPRQISTARDMATLARYILLRYPQYYRYFSTRQFTYKGKTYNNHNRLMRTYAGMDGFKTGYINASGFNLVASAKRNGRRIIGVVYGGRTTKSRNSHMASILDGGFKKVDRARIAHARSMPKPQPKPGFAMAQANAPSLNAGSARSGQERSSFTSLAALEQNRQRTALTNLVTSKQVDSVRADVESGLFDELMGEGDLDMASSKRLETGLLAMAVHTGKFRPSPEPPSESEKALRDAGHAMIARLQQERTSSATAKNASLNPNAVGTWTQIYNGRKWSAQIGAYTSRARTDSELVAAVKKVSSVVQGVRPLSVPLTTERGVIFRARLGNLSKADALQVCKMFKDCITVPPSNP